MINRISKKMVERLLRNNVITQEDYEIYLFGMEQLLATIINLLTCMVIGIVFDCILQTSIFVISFIIIRSYAGGYHASTPLCCYLLTSLTIITAVAAMKYVDWGAGLLVGTLVFAGIVILMLAPVDTENKPIDDIEYIYYRKKTIVVWLVESAVAALCVIFQFEIGAEGIVGALVVMAVALICEKIKHNSK